MGIYLNPGNEPFNASVHSQIYVDKSNLIAYTNSVFGTKQKFICVSRPRRFGKSMAAEMLSAYYDRECNSYELFRDLSIAGSPSFNIHLNKYNVLHLDVQWFRSNEGNGLAAIEMLEGAVIGELRQAYPQYVSMNDVSLPMVLANINNETKEQFIIIIDEWDCLFREDKHDGQAHEKYISLLRGLFKGTVAEKYIKLAYITGILPIKKYGTQSALNNFKEYTMVNPGILAEYVGFIEDEVNQLCDRFDMDFTETRHWYDGYHFRRIGHVYSPKSVVDAMLSREFDSYWTNTETYESLKVYIEMNFDGLKDAIIDMLGGGRHPINTRTFQNDMTTFKSKDDVLTLLVHLGYLTYDADDKVVFIPNQEVADEFKDAVMGSGWTGISKALSESDKLLDATLNQDAEAVAKGIEKIHMDTTSLLSYNDENSLSCVISIAYYSARKDYALIREMPAGKGFADVVFLPRRHSDKPAIIVELKWNLSAEGAISQIRNRQYIRTLEDYSKDVLLVGISYNKKNKIHQCVIELLKK